MAINYTVPHSRGANMVAARAETIESPDGQRRVTFRNNKMSLPGGRFDSVRTAQLKRRVDGRWKIIVSGRSEEDGRKFLLNRLTGV